MLKERMLTLLDIIKEPDIPLTDRVRLSRRATERCHNNAPHQLSDTVGW
jgi:hypothetical protein